MGGDAVQITLHRRLQATGAAAAQADKSLLHRGREKFRFLVGISRKDVVAEHHVRLRQLSGRLEGGAIQGNRLHHLIRRKMRCECVGQAQGGRYLSAEKTRPQYPYRHVQAGARDGANRMPLLGREVIHQFDDIIGKLAGIGSEIAAQGARGELV